MDDGEGCGSVVCWRTEVYSTKPYQVSLTHNLQFDDLFPWIINSSSGLQWLYLPEHLKKKWVTEDLRAQDRKSDEGKISHPRICASILDAQHWVQVILNHLSMGAGKPSLPPCLIKDCMGACYNHFLLSPQRASFRFSLIFTMILIGRHCHSFFFCWWGN